MRQPATITRSSTLRAEASTVWAHVTAMPSINAEMGPWLRMTYPPEARGLTLDSLPVALGVPLFTSWVLLLGVLPVERMAVTLVELEPGRRFVEQSGVLFMRHWRHERSVTLAPQGCQVTDTVTLETPIQLLQPLMAALVQLFFGHRHRQLLERFGSPPDSERGTP